MLIIKSKVQYSIVLAKILKFEELVESGPRINLTEPDDPIQVMGLNLSKKFIVKHSHEYVEPKQLFAVETWIVLRGTVSGVVFDFDEEPVYEFFLNSGDCLVQMRGKHSIEKITHDALFYEIRNGSYKV